MFGYLLWVCLALTLLNYSKGSNISDQRLCYDPKCSEPLSLAKTLLKYVKNYDEGLSFQPGVEVIIYSKSAGSRPELWGAEVGGKRGYIPKGMVQEYKVFHPDETLKYTVPTVMPDETEKKELGVEKQRGSTETVQEKPVDKTIIENPPDINSESSIKKTFDVIDGTTFYDDTLGLATATIDHLDSSSTKMGGMPIESTASFTATPSDMSTVSMSQSDMTPISPTTMLEKPEEHEPITETDEKSPDEEGGMVKSVLNIMSDLVTGVKQEDLDENKMQETKGVAHSTDDGHGVETAKEIGESKIEYGEKVDDDQETTDEDDEDDTDEEEDGDEEDIDGEDVEDEEEEDDMEQMDEDENIKNNTLDNNELNYDIISTEEVQSGTISETSVPVNESVIDEVNSLVPSGVPPSEEPKSILNDGEGVTLMEKKVESMDVVSEVNSETNISSQTTPYLNETSSQELEFSAESSDGAELKKSQNELNPGVDIESYNEVDTKTNDSTSHSVDQKADGSTVDLETPKDVNVESDSVIRENYVHGNSDESKQQSVPDEVLVGGVMKGEEAHEEVPMVTPEAAEKEMSESLILGDQRISFDMESTPEVTSENPITATAAMGDYYSESSVQTEPSNVVSDEYNYYPGDSTLKPEDTMMIEEITGSKEEPQQTLESDKNIVSQNREVQTSSEFTESEPQKDDVVSDSPNSSDTENQLPMPEDSSSGILSTLFDSLGSGYGFVSSLIFGSGDERVEVMEGHEGSSQGVSHITAGKYSDSEHNLYQHSPSEDVQNLATSGDSVFGRSSNSHCEDGSETVCGGISSILPSSDTKDETSEEVQESGSWIGIDSNGIFNFNVPSYGAVIYSIITGIVVLCFFLGHYFIEVNRKDVVLLAKINALEKELTVSSKECLILKEKLKQFEIKSSDFDDSAEVINSMKNELEKVQNEKLAQELGVTESKVLELEEDLKQVSHNLQQRDDEHSKQCAELKELSEIQHNKYLEDVKNKTIETEMALTRCKSLETTLTEMKEMLTVKENEISVLQECLQQLKLSNGDDPDKAEDQLKDILNFGKLKADLTAVTKERDNLKEKLQGEEDARKLLEDHVKVIREEVEKLRKCHEAAEREKVEAQTRLEVLSSYFKEKETQLQKELGNKEALWIQKHTDASTIMQRMKSLEEEVENYKKEEDISKPNISDSVSLKETKEVTTIHPVKECKEEKLSQPDVSGGCTSESISKETVGGTPEKKGSQNETLKKEILDQERGYKTQLATFEKKAHENWVAARQAERKLEESKQEASQLRNRLTMADKTNPTSTSQNGDDSKPNLSMIDSNGELSASPLHLGLASNSSVDMLLSDPHPHYLDPNSSPPHVGGGSRLPPPPLLPPPPFPPLPLPPRSPYHHPLSPPLPFMPLPPPDANLYPSSIDGHRPPPLGRMSSPPPAPSPSQSPHLPPNDSRGGEFPSPYRDRGGGGRSSSPSRLYMPPDDRGLGEEWRMGRYCTPPPHSSHPSDFPIPPYPPRPHWEDEPPHPTSSFRPLPSSSQRTDSHRELKGRKKFSKIRRFWSTLECAPSESHTQTK